MNTLKLTLKKQWFDMVLSGEKYEEYREVKPYWIQRLCWHEWHKYEPKDLMELIRNGQVKNAIKNKFFDKVEFTNGYSKTSPQVTKELLDIVIDYGREDLGGENQLYFVIRLGREVARQNC